MTSLVDKLRKEPGIDLSLLKPGTQIYLETENTFYKMKVLPRRTAWCRLRRASPPSYARLSASSWAAAYRLIPTRRTLPSRIGSDVVCACTASSATVSTPRNRSPAPKCLAQRGITSCSNTGV